MRKLVFFLISFLPILLWSQSRIENSYAILNVPSGWEVQNMPMSGINMEMIYFYNSGDVVYNIGMIIGIEGEQDSSYMLQNQITLKESNMLFANATFGEIHPTTFMGRTCSSFDFSTSFQGETFAGAAYAFTDNGCSLLVVGAYKKGCTSKLPQIWRSIQWKKHERKQYGSMREQLEDFCRGYNRLMESNPQIANGARIMSVHLDENGNDCITYNYRLVNNKKADYSEEYLNQWAVETKKIIVSMFTNGQGLSELDKLCMQESYTFRFVYRDMNDELLYIVNVYPEDYR